MMMMIEQQVREDMLLFLFSEEYPAAVFRPISGY